MASARNTLRSDEVSATTESNQFSWEDPHDGTNEVIGAAIEVHRNLGPGLLESVYEACLCRELTCRGISHTRQVALPVTYKGEAVDAQLRLDIVVETRVIVEVKSVEQILPIHIAQLLTYLRLSGMKVGLLLNFNVLRMTDGIRRVVI